jgi:hypothetical protein
MPTIIPLYRPLLWPRLAVGIAAFGALCLAASLAFAGDLASPVAPDDTAVDVIET